MQLTNSPTIDDRIATVKRLVIENATITLVEHDVTESVTTPDGHVYANLRPRTVVKIVMNPAKGSNINVELCLPDPDKWNGILVGTGNGGAAGHIGSLGLTGYAGGGYAVVTTDMGTAPSAESGIGNREVWKDFGFRATHLMTVAGKQVVRAFYGKDIAYSYFIGGSTGGQQALQEAQRYPEDYDGIFANVPAHCRTPLHAYFLWNYQVLAKCHFTEEQLHGIVVAGNEYMASREAPAVAGKFVSDPRCTAKDIDAVIALALSKDASLTPAHEAALRKLFTGPTQAITGKRIFDGIPIGASIEGSNGHLYLFNWVFGRNKQYTDIDFGKDFDTYTAALGPYLNAENPDLSAFAKHGGKLIMAAGTADQIVPYQSSIDYYDKVIERCGSVEKAQSFIRFFIVPGMSHGGGPGINGLPNPFGALRDWREKGKAPDGLLGNRYVDGKSVLTMPLVAYPAKAVWDPATATFVRVDSPRGGVERVDASCLPAAAE
ncbi:MAG TPA: tannase/feruloyl esterase family alpha/beta hydrolase [Capsulimonadaceae bacterium]|jgi:feruloyl esterase